MVSYDTEKLHKEGDNSNFLVWVQRVWAGGHKLRMATLGSHWPLGCRPEFYLVTNVANNMESTHLIHTTQSYWRGGFQEPRVAGVVQLHCMAEQVYSARDAEGPYT